MKKGIILLSFLFFVSCGTDTGNPGVRRDGAPSAIGAYKISDTACAKVSECNASVTTCYSSVNVDSQFVPALGLSNGRYPRLENVYAAVDNGILAYSDSSYLVCANAIRQLACSHALVVSSYSNSSPLDFSHVHQLLKVSDFCKYIYTEK